jgi:hypothetical protein
VAAVLAHGFNNTIGLVTFYLIGPIYGPWRFLQGICARGWTAPVALAAASSRCGASGFQATEVGDASDQGRRTASVCGNKRPAARLIKGPLAQCTEKH